LAPQLRAAIRGEGGAGGSEEDREALALAELERVRAQLRNVGEDLAAAQRHVEQYKAISAANEETLKAAIEEHRCFKELAEQAQAMAETEAQVLRSRVEKLEAELAEVRGAAEKQRREGEGEREAAEKAAQTAQEEVGRLRRALQEAEARVGALKKDGERTYRDYKRAQQHYEQQVRIAQPAGGRGQSRAE
jgi:chromosome segregation ATPase